MLGKKNQTNRGFEVIEFSDSYGLPCSLQQSAAIDNTDRGMSKPGSSFIFLGVNNAPLRIMKAKAKRIGMELPSDDISGWMDYAVPEDVEVFSRMHLNRGQVVELVVLLQQWLNSGSFGESTTQTQN